MAPASETILALDLATKCGFAVLRGRKRIESGRWTLYTGRRKADSHRAERWINLREQLTLLVIEHKPDVVAYERVRRHVGTSAAHVYGGLLAQLEDMDYVWQNHVERWGEIELVPVEVSVWKKATVGRGNATKTDVQAWARRRFRFKPGTEDEADALGIAEATRLIRREEYP